MALKPCSECGHEFSTKAHACPVCAHPRAVTGLDTSIRGNARTCLGCIVLPLLGFAFVMLLAAMGLLG